MALNKVNFKKTERKPALIFMAEKRFVKQNGHDKNRNFPTTTPFTITPINIHSTSETRQKNCRKQQVYAKNEKPKQETTPKQNPPFLKPS